MSAFFLSLKKENSRKKYSKTEFEPNSEKGLWRGFNDDGKLELRSATPRTIKIENIKKITHPFLRHESRIFDRLCGDKNVKQKQAGLDIGFLAKKYFVENAKIIDIIEYTENEAPNAPDDLFVGLFEPQFKRYIDLPVWADYVIENVCVLVLHRTTCTFYQIIKNGQKKYDKIYLLNILLKLVNNVFF